MNTDILEVKISAENMEQAKNILNSILKNKLGTGGQFIAQPARFLWKGQVTDMDYVTIHTYSTAELKDELIRSVHNTSVEEVPMITFTKPDFVNVELEEWVKKTLN